MTGPAVHVSSGAPEARSKVFRSVRNLHEAGSVAGTPTDVAVVVHGDALPMLLSGSPVADSVEERLTTGVSFRACANTLRGHGENDSTLRDGVTVVPAGVAEIVRL